MGVHKEWQWVSRVLSLLMERFLVLLGNHIRLSVRSPTWHHTAACDEHDSLTIESKEVRCLMLLIIDPEFRRDLEFLGSDKLAQLVEERFRELVGERERTRIFKELEVTSMKEVALVCMFPSLRDT
ncbi:hypothetical protein L2E82_29335 [Cichorium intybus]|uniref:Uncharacterized protein n=1 Tax=Cichorium intybus TaxID=13427 RepID=A0ACB9CXE3_CICIN|nr:hypothetical protein L2E82_52278 [Cichorium intybus]KAI3738999.1 hypothetical protein L2E82_29335 [Cichorium intybus]